MRHKLTLMFVVITLSSYGCSHANFGGSNGLKTTSTDSSTGNPSKSATSANPSAPPGSGNGITNDVDGKGSGSGSGSPGFSPGPDGILGTSDDIPNGGSSANSGNGPVGGSGGEKWSTAPCIKGDKIEFAWTGPIKECFDQGKTYNFDTNTCVAMKTAKFACDWNNVIKELEKASLLTDAVRNAPGTGAKLISCGQSQDGKRTVVQWVKEPTSGKIDCKDYSSAGGVTSGCYTDFSPNPPPPVPTDTAEKKKQVYSCMDTL